MFRVSDAAPGPLPRAAHWRGLLPLLPLLLLLLCGVVFTWRQSLSGTGAYATAIGLPDFGRNLVFSLYVAATAATVSTIGGTLIAYLLWRLPGNWRRWGTGFYLPLILPHITVGFLFIMIFSTSGTVASVFHAIGLEGIFRSPLFRGDGLGIVLAYIYKSAPFALVMVFPILRNTDPAFLQTALMLGAGELRSFFQVILPRLLPGMGSAWIILFVYAFGAYDLPFIIGESSPRMISLYLFRLYFARPLGERPVAAALLALLFTAGMGMVILYSHLASRIEEKERRL